jgi:ATP-dependent Clp protease adaptor protein ClpS
MPSIATPEQETETGVFLDEPWNVIIHNDPVNLMSYVSYVIRKIFGYDEQKAKRLMMEVHTKGRSLVWSGARELAEHYVRELLSHQLMSTMEQSS